MIGNIFNGFNVGFKKETILFPFGSDPIGEDLSIKIYS